MILDFIKMPPGKYIKGKMKQWKNILKVTMVLLVSFLFFKAFTNYFSIDIEDHIGFLDITRIFFQKPKYLTYRPPIAPHIKGRPFHEVNWSFVYSLLPETINLRNVNPNDFVFVTAVSSVYMGRLSELIKSIQQYFPTYKLIVYNLGLKKKDINLLNTFCQVRVRQFNFSKYPPHVKKLRSYAFKPIVVTEVLKEGKVAGVFWVDSSIRFKTNDMTVVHEKVRKSNGVAAFTGTEHSVYSVTVQEMFDYLPSVKDPKVVECIMATFVLIYRTKSTVDNILRWWLTCALSPGCIWTLPFSGCPFAQDGLNRWTEWGNCSRYDQSALSIILYNAFADIDTVLAYRLFHQASDSDFAKINRTYDLVNVKTCHKRQYRLK